MTLARNTDPGTSHLAARSLRAEHITRTQRAIVQLLRDYPRGMTDAEISEHFPLDRFSPSGLRTRRSELVAAGQVRDSGIRGLLPSGRYAIVWVVGPPPF